MVCQAASTDEKDYTELVVFACWISHSFKHTGVKCAEKKAQNCSFCKFLISEAVER